MNANEGQARKVALLCGAGNSLGIALAEELGRRGVSLYLAEHAAHSERLSEAVDAAKATGAEVVGVSRYVAADPSSVVLDAARASQRLDYYVDLLVPTASWSLDDVSAHPFQALRRGLAVAEILAASAERGSAVLHTFLPSMYADSSFDELMPMIKGAITGVTRTLCRRFGPSGLVINCLQTGLVDMPETKSLAKERVLTTKPPVGRWADPSDVAKMISFLLMSKGYYTGQSLVFDGGLTAGITGT